MFRKLILISFFFWVVFDNTTVNLIEYVCVEEEEYISDPYREFLIWWKETGRDIESRLGADLVNRVVRSVSLR